MGGRQRGHSAVAVVGCGNSRRCRSGRCCIVAVCADVGGRETAAGLVLATSGGPIVSSVSWSPWLYAAPRSSKEGARQAQGQRRLWLEAGSWGMERAVHATYQFARQLPAICVCESKHVVSYCTSQPAPRMPARAPRLRTFVQESNCALQLPHSVCARARPRHVQVVEHCQYGRYCVCRWLQQQG